MHASMSMSNVIVRQSLPTNTLRGGYLWICTTCC